MLSVILVHKDHDILPTLRKKGPLNATMLIARNEITEEP